MISQSTIEMRIITANRRAVKDTHLGRVSSLEVRKNKMEVVLCRSFSCAHCLLLHVQPQGVKHVVGAIRGRGGGDCVLIYVRQEHAPGMIR